MMSICFSIRRCITMFVRTSSSDAIYAKSSLQNEFCLAYYDAIGFDLDHTICKYKLEPLYKLIYETLANFLVEKRNYSKNLFEHPAVGKSFVQKGIVLDKERGNFLKLDSSYSIVKATHGSHLMTKEEVCKIYGTECIWDLCKKIPNILCSDTRLAEPFYVFKDYFVTAGALVCARLVDILDEQNGGPLLSYSFWEDVLDGLVYMYERNNFKNNSGKFFPALKQNPDFYLEPCSTNFKDWLLSIKRSKKTFLLTSSNVDFASYSATFCLGKDWTKYFDIIVTFARKPGFFKDTNPFYSVTDNIEASIVPAQDLKPNVIYSQGNCQDLLHLCSVFCGVPKPKLLYVGDSLVEDVYAPSHFAQWDTIAVVEEMLAEGMQGIEESHDATEELSSDFWGSFFCSDKDVLDKDLASLWGNIIAHYSKLSIPDVNVLSSLQLENKIQPFNEGSVLTGYYPGVPKSLIR